MTKPLEQADGYKLSHKKFMRDGTTMLYANITARSAARCQFQDAERRVVWAGMQAFIKDYIIAEFNAEFFARPFKEVIGEWKARVESYLGVGAVSMEHFEKLHKLGYLPLEIKALPEGSKVPFKVPLATWKNTHKDFAWLVTYIETVLSQECWGVTTSATTAYQFLTLCRRFADETVGNRDHIPFQCHDFSARGLMGRQAAAASGYGHLLSSSGTDTIAALGFVDKFYGGYPAGYLVGTSVPASEHSVTSLGIAVDGELETIRYWITEAYPTGIVSIVSDTIDYWQVLTEYLPALKGEIEARGPNGFLPGKVVVRPDSGDPVRIICGYREDEIVRTPQGVFSKAALMAPHLPGEVSPLTDEEVKGSIEVLWERFGGTVNKFGYRELNPSIGLIYGDSITLERAEEIFSRLQQRNFASNNVVFGVGSFTYQYVTRDTLSLAVKATAAVVDGKLVELYKDPKTDSGIKKSARGLMRVDLVDGKFVMTDSVTPDEEAGGELRVIFKDGKLLVDESFDVIRNRVQDIVLPKEEEAEGV